MKNSESERRNGGIKEAWKVAKETKDQALAGTKIILFSVNTK